MAIGDVGGRQNDTPIGDAPEYRLPVNGVPANGQTVVYSDAQGSFVLTNAAAGNSFVATDDAGSGDVASDVNATDFTGQSPIVGQAADIGVNAIANFIHKGVSYQYVGPKPVTVGVGGSYVTVLADYAAQGTSDHALLTNRTAADQHSIAAITGLVAEQAAQDAATAQVQTNLTNHENAADPHPQYAQRLPQMYLYGVCDNFTFNATPSKLVNFTEGGELNTTGAIDQAAGEITVPITGVYRLIVLLVGDQGNDTKEESMQLQVDIDAARSTLSVFDVATDKTDDRSFSASGTRSLSVGQVVSLWCVATAGMGTFSVQNVSFELIQVA